MKRLRFKKIDAFASKYSSGNPAAVVYLDKLEELSEEEKLQIAKELKGFVSEVGYVCPGTETDSAFGYYLLAHGMWKGEKIQIEQNGFRTAPNFVQLFSRKTGASDSRVWFGGSAIVRIDGHYNLE